MANKLPPYQTFLHNVQDAELLLQFDRAFRNDRSNKMRTELRNQIGNILKVSAKQRDQMDCIQNTDLFIVFMPGGNLPKERFHNRTPLLRSSLVAACAALETYVADRTMDFVGPLFDKDELPPRFRQIALTVGQWLDIERRYKRKGWGMRSIVEAHIRETSSTAPNAIGVVLSTIGVTQWASKVDKNRKVGPGKTVEDLNSITKRRNRIVHAADRKPRSRTPLTLKDVELYVNNIKSIVEALESIFKSHKV